MHDLFRLGPRGTQRALALLGALAACLCGCDEPPLREWRPEDHGHARVPESGGAADEAGRAPSEAEAAASPEEAQARATLALWNVTCASCHARDGRGGGPGLPPGARVPDLTEAAFVGGRSDAELAAAIRDGKGMMPAFGPQLGAAGVDAMVAHVRALAAP